MSTSATTSEAHTRTLNDKAAALLKDIVKYNRELKGFSDQILSDPRMFDVNYLFEKTLAILGGYDLLNESHYDFSDKSDAKTSSVSREPVHGRAIHTGRITSVGREGNLKRGALRCAIYIPPMRQMQYFYLPKKYWMTLSMTRSHTGELTIPFSYNSNTNTIAKFDYFRVASLKILACKLR